MALPDIYQVNTELPASLALVDGMAKPTSVLIGAIKYVYNGATLDYERTPTIFKTFSLSAGTTETAIWTPAPGKKFRLMGFIIGAGAAISLTFNDNTAGIAIMLIKVTTGNAIAAAFGNGILSAAVNNPLTVVRSASSTLDGTVYGTEE